MINGHGDDAFRYNGISHNFSSNIFSHPDLSELKGFLSTRLDVIGSYPEPEPKSLEQRIACRLGIDAGCVLVTNGATDAIYLIAEAAAKKLRLFETSEPTFREYADACRLQGMKGGTGELAWLCNPNNPTGHVVPKQEVLQRAADYRHFVLDQSYENYTMEPLLTAREAVEAGNILQLHSLTKTYCVPGLRIGFVVGAQHLINELRQRLRPWSVNALAIEAAKWLIDRDIHILPDLPSYLAEAQRLRSALNAIPGISAEPTQTNFMLCRIESKTASELKEQLATHHGILIRDASNFEGLSAHHFRIAAQTKEEDDLLLQVIGNEFSIPHSPFFEVSKRPSAERSTVHSPLRPIMLAGTGSDVGKSALATALCRIFRQDGYHPAPFKAQNMALNSYATPEGLEIGRAQAVQAEAAGVPCHTDMNPLLLKPQSDHTSQVVLHGKPIGNRDAYDFWRRRTTSSTQNTQGSPSAHDGLDFRAEVCGAFDRLSARYNPIVMEGAGSVSELNLRETDLVNLPMARYAGADVVLVADIDRGGVFASVYGSIALQTAEDRARIKGIIINKFRGDLRLFDDGRELLERLCGVPVLGVVPYFTDIHIEEEDSVSLVGKARQAEDNRVNVVVVLLRHISNFTDFDALEQDTRLHLFYTNNVDELRKADIIILPGSKSTLDDLRELRRNGCAQAIQQAARKGTTVIGICGGFQMMGIEVCDPDHVEGDIERLPGLGLLPVTTTMSGEKITRQVRFGIPPGTPTHFPHSAYEIHMGETRPFGQAQPQPFALLDDGREDGYRVSEKCWGTYLHGVLDNASVVDALLAPFADRLTDNPQTFDYAAFKEEQYDRLADHVRKHLDMKRLYDILTN